MQAFIFGSNIHLHKKYSNLLCWNSKQTSNIPNRVDIKEICITNCTTKLEDNHRLLNNINYTIIGPRNNHIQMTCFGIIIVFSMKWIIRGISSWNITVIWSFQIISITESNAIFSINSYTIDKYIISIMISQKYILNHCLSQKIKNAR